MVQTFDNTGGVSAATAPAWQNTVNRKRQIRDDALKPYLYDDIPPESEKNVLDFIDEMSNLPRFVKDVTNINDVEELRNRIASGDLKAVDVISSYIKRSASIAQHVLVMP